MSQSPVPVKHVLRFKNWIDPIFDATLSARSDIALFVGRFDHPRADNLRLLEQAHVLHLSAAKDEVPKEWFVTEELLSRAPNLLCVSAGGAGYDTIDVPACTQAGVAVVNQAGGNAVSVAEHTIGLMLAVSHRLAESDRRLRGSQRGFSREDLMGREISGKVLGLVGIGHIGTQVARLARAFNMRVLATDPHVDPQEIERRGAAPVALHELLERSDVVSLHCPRLPSTIKMIGQAEYRRMKPGAIFISTARGGIHDEEGLAQALQSGHVAGAGLDVWEVEPPPHDNPLLMHQSVVATFHTAGVTHEGRRNIARISAEQIVQTLDGLQPPRLLNPEVRTLYAKRFSATLGQPVRF